MRLAQIVILLGGLALLSTGSSADPGSKRREVPRPEAVSGQVDELFAEGWKKRELVPAPPAGDLEFLRRLSLDLRGRVPTPEEVAFFLAEPASERRGRRIDEWLTSPEHGDYFSRILSEILLGTEPPPAVRPGVFRLWLRDELARNRPWDEIVRQLVTADRPRSWNGPTNFMLRWSKDPEEMAAATAKLLLGIQIECARCHDHPYERWTQEDFYGLASFFAGTRRVPINMRRLGLMSRFGELDFHFVDAPGVDFYADAEAGGFAALKKAEASGRSPLPSRFLGGKPLSSALEKRRERLARILTDEGGLQLARAFVNRLFQLLFGRGLVEPVDDFGSLHPPSHPRLLELLASDFRASGFDIRRTVRILLGTRAYSLSSRAGPGRAAPPDGFSRGALRQLNPNQLYSSVLTATGFLPTDHAASPDTREAAALYEKFTSIVEETRQLEQTGSDPHRTGFLHCTESDLIPLAERQKMIAGGFDVPVGIRDPTEKDPREKSRQDFLTRIRAVETGQDALAGSMQSLQQSLLLMNGSFLGERITRGAGAGPKPGTLDRVLALSDPASRVEALYLAILSRPPDAVEKKAATRFLTATEDRTGAVEDLLWALIHSSEFLFNH